MIFHFMFYCIYMPVFANNYNNFISDYFKYKKVSSVVGYTCNGVKDDLFLIKSLSKVGVATSLSKSDDSYRVNRFAYTEYWKLGIFLDLGCYDTENVSSIFSEATNYRMYDELHHWLILGSNIDDIINIVDDNAFGLSTDFVIAAPFTNVGNTYYGLYDIYNAWKERGASLCITFMGSWTENNRLIVSMEEAKYKRRSNLFGLTMKASFFYSQYKPRNMTLEDYLQDGSSTKDGLSKFGFIVIRHLSEMFNFTLQSGVVAKWEVGDAIGPIIRALTNKEIDITGSPASMSVKRTYLVKYVHQSWPFRSCFIFRNPQPTNIKINEILGPLEMDVWYLMTVLFILSVLSMSWLLKFETVEGTIKRFSDSILIIVGAICQQSTDIPMNHISTRIALLCIMIFSLLFYNYYSASIVSARLNEPILKINDSLSEMSKLKLKFASEWMAYFEFFIKRPDWETQTFYNNQWSRIPQADQFMLPEKAMRLVKDGGFAYHAHPDVSYPFINQFYNNREICELTEVHLGKPTYSTFAVNLNSTFTEIIKVGITKISEVGIRKRQILRWTSPKPKCHKNILTASSIDIYEFAPHLLILMFGMLLAGAICCVEIILEQITNKNVMRMIIAAKFSMKKYHG